MAYVIWRGDGPSLTEAYTSIMSWISENGYRVVGPPREVYLRDGTQPEKMFEIQYPIEDQVRRMALLISAQECTASSFRK